MSVDCSATSGFGIEVTEEIVDKMIEHGVFTLAEWVTDKEYCLDEANFLHGASGSYYTGEIKHYIFVHGDTIPELFEGAKKFIKKLSSMGIEITIDDIREVCEVLWS